MALALVLTPALAAQSSRAKSARADVASGASFTPAVSDPRLAAALARRGYQTGGFRFTPATPGAGKSKAVRVAIRARPEKAKAVVSHAGEASAPTYATVTPSDYNLGVAVGWKRFSLTGDIARVEKDTIPGARESAEVGISYSGRKLGGKVELSAERTEGPQRLIDVDASYSVDVGASYSIARNLAVTGGVRYKIQRDRLEAINEDRRDSQAVYIGTRLRF